jgi:hypothetical protein
MEPLQAARRPLAANAAMGAGPEDPRLREALIAADQVSFIREIRPDPDEPPIVEISMTNGDTFHVLAQLDDFISDEWLAGAGSSGVLKTRKHGPAGGWRLP